MIYFTDELIEVQGGKVICINFTVRVIVIASLATSSLGGKLVAYRPNPQKYLVWPSVFLHLKNSFRKGKKKKDPLQILILST